jgi:hypothetical protein
MPAAARADSENRGGAVGVRMSLSVECDDEHAASTLRHSEVASVENSVGPPVPEFAQRTEERPKILAAIRGEESRNVLEEDGGRSVALHKGKEGEGEAGAGIAVGDWDDRPVSTLGICVPVPVTSRPVTPSGVVN